MTLFNDIGQLTHQPTLDLSEQWERKLGDYFRSLLCQGCTMTEIRALGSYFNAEMAICELVLSKKWGLPLDNTSL